eukprot:CAMPEP_0177680958 /NCGR_PEP_ID=MMETSP0447-20121125/30451_1 /TAXON_ID=0 /ORGANISM="Stygamoeba regulata, Strain BSH-02190019" /LENGTH=542 /DNA_ID=CAMNT_0019190325 /DNA_START=98 /DNA_END=1723 /DNA_ORIENTATION=+
MFVVARPIAVAPPVSPCVLSTSASSASTSASTASASASSSSSSSSASASSISSSTTDLALWMGDNTTFATAQSIKAASRGPVQLTLGQRRITLEYCSRKTLERNTEQPAVWIISFAVRHDPDELGISLRLARRLKRILSNDARKGRSPVIILGLTPNSKARQLARLSQIQTTFAREADPELVSRVCLRWALLTIDRSPRAMLHELTTVLRNNAPWFAQPREPTADHRARRHHQRQCELDGGPQAEAAQGILVSVHGVLLPFYWRGSRPSLSVYECRPVQTLLRAQLESKLTQIVDEGGIKKCPLCMARRKTPVPLDVLDWLSADARERVERLLLHMHLRADPRVRFCPRNGCNNAVEVLVDTASCQTVVCDACFLQFCTECNQPWSENHRGITCQQYQDQVLARIDPTFGQLAKSTRRCPDCGVFLERTEGCNHMTCTCGAQFCYVCLQNYHSHNSSQCGVLAREALGRVPVQKVPVCTDPKAVRTRCVYSPAASQDVSGTILDGKVAAAAEARQRLRVRGRLRFAGIVSLFVVVSVLAYEL